jgi:hypothetical protein
MLGFLRTKLTFSNAVALTALFVALSGAAYAAIELPKNSVGTKQLRKGAVTKAKIKPATVKALRGATGPAGPPGPVGPAGGTLPAGVTLRGTFALGQDDGTSSTSLTSETGVSFGGYALATRPAINLVLPSFSIPAPLACPGTADAPEAAPGNLCVYATAINPNSAGQFFVGDLSAPPPAPASGVTFNVGTKAFTQQGDGRASRFGFIATHVVSVTPGISAHGTWAVTG